MFARSFLLTMQHGGGGLQTMEKQLCKELESEGAYYLGE